jgi:hypothetical protein
MADAPISQTTIRAQTSGRFFPCPHAFSWAMPAVEIYQASWRGISELSIFFSFVDCIFACFNRVSIPALDGFSKGVFAFHVITK